MRLPDFLIIGASKCGTTTLYQYLERHPQIYMSDPKEPEFFASENDKNYAKGIDWYASLFNEAKPDQVCGEASGRYTHWPHYPEVVTRIAQTLPKAKLIYIMRHPVDRAYSHYVQEIKYNQIIKNQLVVPESFEDNLKRENRFLDISHYMMQIEQYLQFFPKESFLFLLIEDLKQPAETLKKVCRFIGVDDNIDLIENQPVTANVGRHFSEGFLRSRITAPLRSIPGMTRLARLFPQKFRDQIYQGLRKIPYYETRMKQQYVPPSMHPETRLKLLEYFQEPNERLAQLLQRDLSAWSK